MSGASLGILRILSSSLVFLAVLREASRMPRNSNPGCSGFYRVSGGGIDCFKCVSIGGDNKPCDDPFHNNGSLGYLESPCLGGRKGRDGLFPATACIKLAGIYDESGVSLTVRSCALDSGTLTTDSELIRMSHCGGFYFDNKYVRGCVQSCSDADACNASRRRSISAILLVAVLFIGYL